MKITHLPAFVAVLLLGASATSSQADTAQRPNILFISIDDLRNDLGVLGAAHAKTPRLDAFAATARGIRTGTTAGSSATTTVTVGAIRIMTRSMPGNSAKPAISRNSHGDSRTVRNDRWRLIARGDGTRAELFDYETDPGETINHAADHPEVVQSLLQLLK